MRVGLEPAVEGEGDGEVGTEVAEGLGQNW